MKNIKNKIFIISSIMLFLIQAASAQAETVKLRDVPSLPDDTLLFDKEKRFGYRGKIGVYQYPPCKSGIFHDDELYFKPGIDTIANDPDFVVEDAEKGSVKFVYLKNDKKLFAGAYIVVMGDIQKYDTMTFLIKGRKGGETFEIGMNDTVSNKREDAVFIGSIHRYLPDGITTDWQVVKIPLSDFYGPNIAKTYTLVFLYNELGAGSFWIDELRFTDEIFVTPQDEIDEKGYLLLDNFDHSNLNLLGRKTNTYKKLPSVCQAERVKDVKYGEGARSMRLRYDKASTGWCGYFSLLNQVDGEYYDLSRYKSVSFMVKGERGGEDFEIGMADKNWIIIGDSLKAGQVTKYLEDGVTTEWQEVKIPLEHFGLLDLTQMGSFVINFNAKGKETIYIDDLKFHLKTEEELLAEW